MRIREILRKYIINNIGYKILAVVFSFVLWLVILNITDPEYTRTINNIPVQIQNESMILDGTHVYTISSGETTSVSVTGKRSIVYTLSANDFLVTADFAELSITNAVPIKVELTGDKMRYSGQISIIPRDTSMIINLEDMTSKVIPVELEYRGDLEDNVVIDEANISPKKLVISAPESVTNSAEKAVITANSSAIVSDTVLTLEPVIRNVNGSTIPQTGDTSLDSTEISVEFKVSFRKEVPIAVNVSGNVKEGYTFSGLELSQDSIMVKGSQENIRSLRTITIPNDVINIDGMEEDTQIEIDVTPYLPENIVVYGESPLVTVTVQIAPVPEENTEAPEENTEVPEENTEVPEAEPDLPDAPGEETEDSGDQPDQE